MVLRVLFIMLLVLFSFQITVGQVGKGDVNYSVPSQGKRISIKDTIRLPADSLMVVRDYTISYHDTIVRIPLIVVDKNSVNLIYKDSLYQVADTAIVNTDTIFTVNQKVFYAIEEIQNQDNLIGDIAYELLRFERPVHETGSPGKESQVPYKIYEDKTIGEVYLKLLEPLGTSITDTSRTPKSILEKSGNFIHIKSKKSIIQNRLRFSEGEDLDPLKVAESERLLRSLQSVYDADIIVKPRSLNSDTVDVYVITQDVFSLDVGGFYDPGSSKKGISLNQYNFLGLGHHVWGKVEHHPEFPGNFNLDSRYTVNNISNTLASAYGFYRIRDGRNRYGFGFNREFVTPSISLLGGINFLWHRSPYRDHLKLEPSHYIDSLRYDKQDLWLGYAFNTPSDEEDENSIILSGRLLRTDYYNRYPGGDKQKSNPDEVYLLGSIGYFKRRSYKDRFVFQYGATEDIPEGENLSLIYGHRFNSGQNNPYIGVSGQICNYFADVGYFYSSLSAGTYYRKDKDFFNSVISGNLLYFSPLIALSRWKIRQFMGARYISGSGYSDNGRLLLNDQAGIRGYDRWDLRGRKRLIINTETNIFLPFDIIGFRAALVTFADVGWISEEDNLLDRNNFFPAVGAGIKVRNDHLAFPGIQIMVGYYPNVRAEQWGQWQYFQRRRTFFNYTHFSYGRPSPIAYN